jgi:hypothetical protein
MNGFTALSRGVTAAVALSTLLACGGKSNVNDDPVVPAAVGSVYLGDDPVYAILEPGSDGSWVFSRLIPDEVAAEGEFLVRLNDLAPAFDTRVAECAPQAYPLNHKCNPTHPFRDREIGVVKRIVNAGVAAGTAGQITEVNGTYKTTFDEARLNTAVDEALINSGLNQDRPVLFERLARYQAALVLRSAELNNIYAGALQSYEEGAAESVNLVAQLNGLTEYYGDDVDFGELITVRPRQSSRRAAVALTAGEPVLPCPTRSCLQKLDTAYADLERKYQQARAGVEDELASRTAAYEIDCGATAHAGYNFTLECPSQITRNAEQPQQVPVRVTLLSRDFVDLYPAFELGDDRLTARSDGETLILGNLTSSYLSVSAVTLYYNSRLNTVSLPKTLAPMATQTVPLAQLASPPISVEARYLDMTPDKAARADFSHGFALKYELSGDGTERTLHRVDSFNVACTIQNRLAPGSCAVLAAADVTKPTSEPTPDEPTAEDRFPVGPP